MRHRHSIPLERLPTQYPARVAVAIYLRRLLVFITLAILSATIFAGSILLSDTRGPSPTGPPPTVTRVVLVWASLLLAILLLTYIELRSASNAVRMPRVLIAALLLTLLCASGTLLSNVLSPLSLVAAYHPAWRTPLTTNPTTFPTSIAVPYYDPRTALNEQFPTAVDTFDSVTWAIPSITEGQSYKVEHGVLSATDFPGEANDRGWPTLNVNAPNAYAEASFTFQQCVPGDYAGLVIRSNPADPPSGYALELSCDGYWRFIRHEPNAPSEQLTPWAFSQSAHTGPGASNRVGIWTLESQFGAYINGRLVAALEYAPHPPEDGAVALYVQSTSNNTLQVSFDDFALWPLGSLFPPP